MSYKKGKGRVTLKSYFEAGEIPTEGQFNDFIDSNLNKIDDQITVNTIETDSKTAKYLGIGSKDPKSPMSIANKTGDSNLMGFENANGKEEWQLKINPDEKAGLLIQNNDDPNAALLLNANGKVGIGSNDPAQALSIESQEDETNISIKNSKTLGQGALIGTDENQNLNIKNLESGNIQLGHENAPNQLVLMENGNVGIGIDNPLTPFVVKGRVIKEVSMICGNGPNEEIDIGRIVSRTLLFTKHYNDTCIKITYCDNIRLNHNSQGSARWEVRINGSPPPEGNGIYQDVYTCTHGHTNFHLPATIKGLAKGLSAGNHSIEVWLSVPHPEYGGTDCHTGWNGSTWSIEAEEVWAN